MFRKKIKLFILIFIFYQTPLLSKSNSLEDLNSKKLSNYFSGIVASQNRNNSEALNYFNSSKDLINKHNPYLKRYIYSLVLEKKVSIAIKNINTNRSIDNSNFFEFYLLLIIDNLNKNNFIEAQNHLSSALSFVGDDRLNLAILETLKQFIFVFKEKKLLKDKKDFGNLTLIAETFQRCYLDDSKTDKFFLNLINNYNQIDYTRYLYFYLSYLAEKQRYEDAEIAVKNVEFINSTLLLSQGKNWIDDKAFEKFNEIFSCKNHNDIIGEFLFLISNLYSSQSDFKKSNFYLSLSNFLNSKFIFNLSLEVENHYENKEYKKAKKLLKQFSKKEIFYYWYRIKKEAQIIAITKNKKNSLKYLISEYDKIKDPNKKMIFDVANFYKNSKKYDEAIKFYTKIINTFNDDKMIKSDLLYRRGASYERVGKYKQSDEDLLHSLKINPDDAYVLNYLAYSWLERNYKIPDAIKMLEIAYEAESDDPYIIDSIGWAYYLINDYLKAEQFLKRAVELMPNDPIVNDHYGDILWKLDRKIQARYFWKGVLKMKDLEEDMIKKINLKLVQGIKNS